MADFTQVIKLNPYSAIAYNDRGVARFNLQDYSGAIADYTQTIKLNPEDAQAYHNRGVARRKLKDYSGGDGRLQPGHRTQSGC